MATLDWSQCPAVESIPGKVSGAWVLKGTRMPVSAIFENIEAGAGIDDIMERFDGLDREQVKAVIDFAARMANEAEPAALAIGHFDTIDPALLEPVVAGLEQSGISVRVVAEPSPGGGAMGHLALMETVVVLKVSEILFRKVLEEAGKDAYAALRRAFTVIWEWLHRVRDPGYSNTYSMKLSLTVEQSGKTLKLLLPPTATPEDAEMAFTKFIELARGRRQERPITLRQSAPPEVVVFNATTNRLIAIDPDSDD